MRTFVKAVCFFILFLVTVGVPVLCSAWVEDGTPICTATGNQQNPQINSDDAGGAIITWEDFRSGNKRDIYAERVDASGAVQWVADGVPICTATGNQYYPELTSDGAGGAIITWFDYRSGSANSDIYAQRANASGAVQWPADGVAICMATGSQQYPELISDATGGAIITWQDLRSGTNCDIYVQRVDASGAVQWPADGVLICTATGDQQTPQIISDGAGGAILTWEDYRGGNADVYAQRVTASGEALWTAPDGHAICTATLDQHYPELISDGAGGAIITWYDHRGGSNYDIYAQRVDASGKVQWAVDGVAICAAAGDQQSPQLTSDGAGGAIVTWFDYRSGSEWNIYDIYAQRVNALGAVQWAADGVAISTAEGYQFLPLLTSDDTGGAIITWQDLRSGYYWDIYAQRVSASGTVQWVPDGVAICTATGDQVAPQLTSDGAGGAIITWQDYGGGNADVYAQRVPAGIANVPLTPQAATGLSQNVPNPFNPLTHIKFSVATPGEVSLRIYDIAGRMLRTLVRGWREPGEYSETWDGKGDDGRSLPSGVYFYTLKTSDYTASHKMVLLK